MSKIMFLTEADALRLANDMLTTHSALCGDLKNLSSPLRDFITSIEETFNLVYRPELIGYFSRLK